ncbi:Kae1-associated kinase Bud32 [Candidatus Bathyarchaeota archaeon ex4484_231]|nr:MAG: Kae1-associated kinase Bud32 [Candidatus Bathyarchaeota archaeon ex4484_231]RJS76138.1 MAG: Kae1-associated serine/threonine protein kinase [Candidatus Bathyarchaeota archaeon]
MESSMLIKKGAEASLFLEEWHGLKVILKKRLSKKYRVPELDRTIQIQRTKHEPHVIHRAKEAGVPTPVIYMVDLAEATIVMEYVEGKQVKNVLNELPTEKRIKLCRYIGELIGKLHGSGIIHGDLTTSNMILTPTGKMVFIDFGLSEQTMEVEAKGVDLHLLKRALHSTHYLYADECFETIMEGYEKTVGEKEAKLVLEKILEIEKRGRYVSER